MPKTTVKKVVKKAIKRTAEKLDKTVLCGHEEVLIAEKEEDKVFTCGAHGEHKLKECQKLCV